MNLNDLLEMVDPGWQEAFLKFVETGEAEQNFLEYLDRDSNAQKAVELAFTQQASAFEEFALAMKTKQEGTGVPEADSLAASAPGVPERVAAGMVIVDALEGVLRLSPERQREAVQRAAHRLQASVNVEQKGVLKELVRDLAQSWH